MSAMTDHGLTKDLKAAARAMKDAGVFVDGQEIMIDAAKEIVRLRDELVRMQNDRPYIMGFNAGWDAAVESNEVNTGEPSE